MKLTESKDFAKEQQSAKEADKSGWKFEAIEGTPFTIVNDEGVLYGLCGQNRITEGYDKREDLEKDLKAITWDRITQVIYTMVEKFETLKIKKDE